MTESESVALPFGDTPLGFTPLTRLYYTHFKLKIKYNLKKRFIFFEKCIIIYPIRKEDIMYEMKTRVSYSQVKSDLKTDMSAIAHYFQDCTIFHSESIGKGLDEVKRSQTAWFLSSWQIEVLRYPEFGEEITVRTWAHDFKGIYGYRNFDILDGNGVRIVQANSIWIFMDLQKMLPAKPTEEDVRGYEMEPALSMDYAPRKIKIMEEEKRQQKELAPIVVKKSFLDSNHHVNNGRYVSEAVDFFPEDREIKAMRVDYRKAAAFSDVMYPAIYDRDEVRQIVLSNEENKPYVIIEIQ